MISLFNSYNFLSLVVSILIYTEDKDQSLLQKRTGLNGREINILKFKYENRC